MNTKHDGNLVITEDNKKDFDHITEVTGYLDIRANAQLQALTTVGGGLYISADAQLPALTTVGSAPYIRSST